MPQNFKKELFSMVNINNDENVIKFVSAAANGKLADINEYISNGIDVNAKHPVNGNSAITVASSHNHEKVVELLLLNGADPTQKNQYNDSALSFAHGTIKKLINEYLENPYQFRAKRRNQEQPETTQQLGSKPQEMKSGIGQQTAL
jgi:ankyrin repeat protein